MATETDANCPICQDSGKNVASALPCRHRFCLCCILRWAHRNPSCPLCRTPIETVRFSEQDEWDYVQLVITSRRESSEGRNLSGRTPDHADENSMPGSEVSPVSSPQGALSPADQGAAGPEPVGGLMPKVWARLFQQNQQLLEPVQPWLRQRLKQIRRGRWWLVEATESCILRYLCLCGLDAEALKRKLQVFLGGHTAPLVHGLVEVVAAQCSKEALRLLHSHPAGEEENSQADRTSSSRSSSSRSNSSRSNSSSFEGSTPTNGSSVEEEAGTSGITQHGVPSHHPPVPDHEEWEQPQQEPEQPAVAGPSALSQGRGCLPGVTPCTQKKKVPRPLDSPQ
ncbi:E3 ubiquitin-protein ligase Topors-like protein [Turdus rufiventris]|nr:E3 ubiquitin-protein ligase Topors-like protein [Turdus rufiventris]